MGSVHAAHSQPCLTRVACTSHGPAPQQAAATAAAFVRMCCSAHDLGKRHTRPGRPADCQPGRHLCLLHGCIQWSAPGRAGQGFPGLAAPSGALWRSCMLRPLGVLGIMFLASHLAVALLPADPAGSAGQSVPGLAAPAGRGACSPTLHILAAVGLGSVYSRVPCLAAGLCN